MTRPRAEAMLEDARALNPGPWVEHSRLVACAALRIATAAGMDDPDLAYTAGLLHDIGRRFGPSDLRHVLDGYRYLAERGFPDHARVCITHSFPTKRLDSYSGALDVDRESLARLERYLSEAASTDLDRLIQLCDCLARTTGYCVVEQRMVDVALRHGVREAHREKWAEIMRIKRELDTRVGGSVYSLLPGIAWGTLETETLLELTPLDAEYDVLARDARERRADAVRGSPPLRVAGASALVLWKGEGVFEVESPDRWRHRGDGRVEVGIACIGGGILPGESPVAALQREAVEEIGSALELFPASRRFSVDASGSVTILPGGSGAPLPFLSWQGTDPGYRDCLILSFLAAALTTPRAVDLGGILLAPLSLLLPALRERRSFGELRSAGARCELHHALPECALLAPSGTLRALLGAGTSRPEVLRVIADWESGLRRRGDAAARHKTQN